MNRSILISDVRRNNCFFLAIFSAVTLDTPKISREENRHENQTEQSTSYISRHNIFREYVSGLQEDHLSSQTEYVQLTNELFKNRPMYIHSLFSAERIGALGTRLESMNYDHKTVIGR